MFYVFDGMIKSCRTQKEQEPSSSRSSGRGYRVSQKLPTIQEWRAVREDAWKRTKSLTVVAKRKQNKETVLSQSANKKQKDASKRVAKFPFR